MLNPFGRAAASNALKAYEENGKMFDIDSMGGLVALLAIVLVFGTPVIIVIAILVHKSRRTQRIHQTVVALAEKGLPIPPDLFADRPPQKTPPLHTAVILIGTGLGLIVFFLSIPDRHTPWGVGMIPLLIGVGYLIVWKLEGQKNVPKDVQKEIRKADQP